MYPTEHPLMTLTIEASGTVEEKRFVDVDGDYPTAAARVFGVTRVAAESGDNLGVHVLGTAIVEAGEAISAGGAVEAGTSGKAAAYDSGIKAGIALTAATDDGDLIEVYLVPTA